MDPDEIPFQAIVDLLDQCLADRPRGKAERLRLFYKRYLDRSRTDLFKVIRLLLPKWDSHRGNYQCQEAKLIDYILKALSIDKHSDNAAQVLAWKSNDSARRGHKLATVLEQVCTKTYWCIAMTPTPQHLFRNNCASDGSTLTVGELNAHLDALAAMQTSTKADILRTLCMRSTARMMFWIVCIILKDLKVSAFGSLVLSERLRHRSAWTRRFSRSTTQAPSSTLAAIATWSSCASISATQACPPRSRFGC